MSWGRIGSHVDTRVHRNAAVREGSTGPDPSLVPVIEKGSDS